MALLNQHCSGSVGRLTGLPREAFLTPLTAPLCDQEEETMQQLLVSCALSQQVWF